MSETDRLKLPKIDGNVTANVPRDFNALAEAIDEKVASKEDLNNVEVPVTSVNEKDGDVVLTAEDVGAATPQDVEDAEQSVKDYADQQVADHSNKKDNPHAVTKVQVGLSNVANVEQASKVDHDQLVTDFTTHSSNETIHGTYTDTGNEPDYTGAKYKLVVINGEPFLEVIAV